MHSLMNCYCDMGVVQRRGDCVWFWAMLQTCLFDIVASHLCVHALIVETFKSSKEIVGSFVILGVAFEEMVLNYPKILES